MSEKKELLEEASIHEGRIDEEASVSTTDEISGKGWKASLPLVILTVAPSLYLVSRIYLRTGDVGLAIGAGIICPFCIYGAIGAWLDTTSAFTRSSWARWSKNHADERPLIFAIVGAIVFVAIFTLMWLISPAVTNY